MSRYDVRYETPESVGEACTALGRTDGAAVLAGGTDLLDLIKRGLFDNAGTLVSLRKIPGLPDLTITDDGTLRVGSAVTLANLAAAASGWPALAEAARSVATPQIRNTATVGGNLCQRPRCRFFRSPDFSCARNGGTVCLAAGGGNRYHSIFGGGRCLMAHPSDLAPALIAYGARAVIASAAGSRTIPIGDLFLTPSESLESTVRLAPGELLTGIEIPAAGTGGSAFVKAAERRSIDFALASVAVSLTVREGIVTAARVAAGGVAPVPIRLRAVESRLEGLSVGSIDLDAAASESSSGARPLAENRYKVDLLRGVVKKAIRSAIGRE